MTELSLPDHDVERGRPAPRSPHAAWWLDADGERVSVASRPRAGARRVSRVGPVYTPPEHVVAGYAGAVTALPVVGRVLRRSGPTVVVLCTRSPRTPTSTRSTERIGYVHVADGLHLRFVATSR